MATAQQIRDACDAKLATFWPAFQTRQTTYFSGPGSGRRYFQALASHAVIPANGIEAPSSPVGRPTNQTEGWGDSGFTLPATMPMAMLIHVYDGPLGRGYVARIEVLIGLRRWAKTLQIGQETWRERAWGQIIQSSL